MRFYRNSAGAIAKLLLTSSGAVVLFPWVTKFFDSERAALRFLILNGYSF